KNPALGDILIDEDAPPVLDVVERKGDNLTIPGLSLEEFAKFRDRVQAVAYRIKGSLTERQRGVYSNSIMGQMLTKFRTWMFGLAETRMGAMKYAPDLGAYEIGRFRVGFGDVAHGFRINLKETTKL